MSTKFILSNIAAAPEPVISKRASFFILSKPGSGSTTLAKQLEILTRSVVIGREGSVTSILESQEEQQSSLLNGLTLASDTIFKEVEKTLASDKAQYKGFILDGFPYNHCGLSFAEQFLKISNIVKAHGNSVLIDMRIDDQDLIRRKAAGFIDPVTNVSYSGQQILYCRKRRLDGWTEGEDKIYTEEREIRTGKKSVSLDDLPEEGEVIEEEDLGFFNPALLTNQKSYPILSEMILDRLVKSPESQPERVIKELELYKEFQSEVDNFKKLFSYGNIIELDASQHPEVVFDHLAAKISAKFSDKLQVPFAISVSEAAINMPEIDAMNYYCSWLLREHEPERELSSYNRNCPVTLFETNQLVESKLEFMAVYRGKLYFFENEEALYKFTECPEKYLKRDLSAVIKNVAVLGGSKSQKEIVAKCISEKYGLGLINIEDSIRKLETTEFITDPLFLSLQERVVKSLKSGSSISTQLCAEIAIKLIDDHKRECDRLSVPFGWILVGYPASVEQLDVFRSMKCLPESSYYIKSDPKDLDILSFFKGSKANLIGEKLEESILLFNLSQAKVADDISEVSAAFLEAGLQITTVSWSSSPLAIIYSILMTFDSSVPQAKAIARPEDLSLQLMGNTKDFCPVANKDLGRLLKGDPNSACEFKDKTYFLADEDSKAKFLAQPYFYTKSCSIPPPRIWFIGAAGSGRYTAMLSISQKYSIPIVEMKQYCMNTTFSTPEITQDIKNSSANNGNLSTELLIIVLQSLYTLEPYASKGFLMKGFPLVKEDVETAIQNQMIPDAIIFYNIDPLVAIKRLSKYENQNDNLENKIELESAAVSELQTICDAMGSINCISLQTSAPKRVVLADTLRELRNLLQFRNNLFTSTIKLEKEQSESLIQFGIKRLSNTKKLCPVTLKENLLISVSNLGAIPFMIGNEIFFVKEKEVSKFVENTIYYLNQEDPTPMMEPTCCVLGGVKSGASSLASSLSKEFKLAHLTVPAVLQAIIDGKEITLLHEEIKEYLEAGLTVPDRLVVRAIVLISNRVISAGRGWVLAGFPVTLEQSISMDNAGFRPNHYFCLSLDDNVIIERVKNDLVANIGSAIPNPDYPFYKEYRIESWKFHEKSVQNFIEGKYSNWVTLNGDESKWSLKNKCSKLMVETLTRKQLYTGLKTLEKASPCSKIGISNLLVQSNMSHFGWYCPVSLVDKKILQTIRRDIMVEYKEKYYFLSSEESKREFMKTPDRFASQTLPPILPIICTKNDIAFPVELQLRAYCPVTYGQGKVLGFKGIVPGNKDFIVNYGGKYWCFLNETKQSEFMLRPWVYCNLVLPNKLPPPAVNISVSRLPIIGYLEQTVLDILNNSLVSVGRSRPKYPFKDLSQSSTYYLGLFLKANNPSSAEWIRGINIGKLEKYESQCSLLKNITNDITYLTNRGNNPSVIVEAGVEEIMSLQ